MYRKIFNRVYVSVYVLALFSTSSHVNANNQLDSEFNINSNPFITETKIQPEMPTSQQKFGNAVSVFENRLLVGSSRDNQNGSFAGSAYIFEYVNGTWQEMQKIIGDDIILNDIFGFSVSLGQNRAIVGSRVKIVDGVVSAGAVYVFELSNDMWVQTAKITANTPILNANFGYSVSLSGDNLLIGAPGNGNGSVELYTYDDVLMQWTYNHTMTANDGSFADRFGESISMNTSQAIIGANQDDAGSAYVFDYLSNIQQQKLTAEFGVSNDSFGKSVSLSGNRLLVGAPNDTENGDLSGAAIVFEFDSNNSLWVQTQKIMANDGQIQDFFGYTVSLNAEEVLIGAYKDDNENGGNAGSAYLYKKDSMGWSQSDKFLASDGGAANEYGKAVCLSPEWAIIGSDKIGIGSLSVGAAYIYNIGIFFVDGFE